ncbi:MAG: fibronectin type III domain-containing protein [Caulobacteraceae bacterium]|nr:fibronectin type III domain-containing protein [Caulobacteraceae bacterium]
MRPRGGIIGTNVTPTQTAASGIWTLREVEAYQRSGSWAALPGAPTSVSGTFGAGQVPLTWTAPAVTGGYSITDYAIQYSSNSGSSWTTFSHSASATANATVTGLTNGTGYVFRVAAVTVLGTGPYSTASSTITPLAYTPTAVLLNTGTSYTVPSGATTMKAWAVGAGGAAAPYTGAGAGGTCYKTYSVYGGSTVTYSCGVNANTVVTYGGVTITGYKGNGATGGSFSGGDGGVNGGNGSYPGPYWGAYGGAVGGNAAALLTPCNRRPMTDVSGLLAALALAGVNTTPSCASNTFGSGGYYEKYDYLAQPGYGGGAAEDQGTAGDYRYSIGVVVLYFS